MKYHAIIVLLLQLLSALSYASPVAPVNDGLHDIELGELGELGELDLSKTCSVCFEDYKRKLIAFSPAVPLNDGLYEPHDKTMFTKYSGKRACRHIFCANCAYQICRIRNSQCPLCMTAVSGFVSIDSIRNLNRAFQLFDIDDSRTISKKELMIAAESFIDGPEKLQMLEHLNMMIPDGFELDFEQFQRKWLMAIELSGMTIFDDNTNQLETDEYGNSEISRIGNRNDTVANVHTSQICILRTSSRLKKFCRHVFYIGLGCGFIFAVTYLIYKISGPENIRR